MLYSIVVIHDMLCIPSLASSRMYRCHICNNNVGELIVLTIQVITEMLNFDTVEPRLSKLPLSEPSVIRTLVI